jgi:hypothetical protein
MFNKLAYAHSSFFLKKTYAQQVREFDPLYLCTVAIVL